VTRPWDAPFSADELRVLELYRRARPPFDWGAVALLVVDLTENFIGPRLPALEAASTIRTACGESGWEALPQIAALLQSFRSGGKPVVFLRPDWDNERLLGGATAGDPRSAILDGFPPQVGPEPGELVLVKARASAFFGTPLASYLIRHGVKSVVLAGCTTSGCIRATAVDAASLGFQVAVASDACFDRVQTSHWVALQDLSAKYAEILDTPGVLAAMRPA
jgi:nicotinamidase-related amidase